MKNSNRFLFDEAPLVVQPQLACAIGLYETLFLQLVHYWLQKSDKVFDDRKWTYNTYEGWQKQLRFLSERTVQRTIRDLEERKILLIGNFNKSKMDKTKWYSIDYDELEKCVKEAENNDEKALSRTCQIGTFDSAKTCIDDAKLAPSNMPDWHDGSCQIGTMQHAKLAPPIPITSITTMSIRQSDRQSVPEDAKSMLDDDFERSEEEETESREDYFLGLLKEHVKRLSPAVAESYGRRFVAIAEKVQRSKEPFVIDKRKVDPWEILQQMDWLVGNEEALIRAYQVIDKKSDAVKNRVGYAVSVLYNTAVEAVIFQNGGEEGWIG